MKYKSPGFGPGINAEGDESLTFDASSSMYPALVYSYGRKYDVKYAG